MIQPEYRNAASHIKVYTLALHKPNQPLRCVQETKVGLRDQIQRHMKIRCIIGTNRLRVLLHIFHLEQGCTFKHKPGIMNSDITFGFSYTQNTRNACAHNECSFAGKLTTLYTNITDTHTTTITKCVDELCNGNLRLEFCGDNSARTALETTSRQTPD